MRNYHFDMRKPAEWKLSTKKNFKSFNFFLEIKINIYKINNKFLIFNFKMKNRK